MTPLTNQEDVNMKKTVLAVSALMLAAVAGSALAVEAEVVTTASVMDVKEFVSVTPSDNDLVDVCGVVSQTMKYIDSEGKLKQVTFSRWGGGCGNG